MVVRLPSDHQPKFKTAKQEIDGQAAAKQQENLRKVEEKRMKRLQKEENAGLSLQRRQQRVAEAERKKRTKEEGTQQRLANLQIKKDSRQQAQTPKARPKG